MVIDICLEFKLELLYLLLKHQPLIIVLLLLLIKAVLEALSQLRLVALCIQFALLQLLLE